jgi:hypothetical protein
MKKVISFLFSCLLLFAAFGQPANATTFSDIQNTFAKNYIETLGQQGVISGFPDGTYRPNNPIKRSEFAKMLALALDLPLNEDSASSFTDVPNWAKPYVGALVDAEITNGKKPGQFGSDLPITRQEMIIMFVRAMGFEEFAHFLYLPSEFADEGEISTTAYPYVSFAEHMGFAEGNLDNEFMPLENGTRAAAAKWIYFFVNESDKYFSNALTLIAVNTVDNILQVELIDDFTVEVTYMDNTTEEVSLFDFIIEMGFRLQYFELSYFYGSDWNTFTGDEKDELLDFIVIYWTSEWSDFNLLVSEEEAISQLKDGLNTHFANVKNEDDILLEQIETIGLENGIIELINE